MSPNIVWIKPGERNEGLIRCDDLYLKELKDYISMIADAHSFVLLMNDMTLSCFKYFNFGYNKKVK